MTMQVEVESIKSSFRITPLQPFGVLARPVDARRLEEIASGELDRLVREHQLVVIRGLDGIGAAEFEAYCRRFGELLDWPFGYVLELKAKDDATNYLFTRDRVPFHWDGVFARKDPHYLFFNCVQAPAEGGESLFSDTIRVLKRAKEDDRKWLETCVCRYQQARTAHYGGDVTTNLIRKHPFTGEATIRYTEPVSGVGGNAPELVGADEAQTRRLADFMAKHLYEPEVCLSHRWVSGDFLIFDNHRLLHGRKAFGTRSERHIRRVHIL